MNCTPEDVTHFGQYFRPLKHDPNATRSLHSQAGSFYWSDEMPDFVDDGHPASIKMFMVSLLGFRTMRMQGENVPEYEPLWNRLRDVCPEWPGFKRDRMDPVLLWRWNASSVVLNDTSPSASDVDCDAKKDACFKAFRRCRS